MEKRGEMYFRFIEQVDNSANHYVMACLKQNKA